MVRIALRVENRHGTTKGAKKFFGGRFRFKRGHGNRKKLKKRVLVCLSRCYRAPLFLLRWGEGGVGKGGRLTEQIHCSYCEGTERCRQSQTRNRRAGDQHKERRVKKNLGAKLSKYPQPLQDAADKSSKCRDYRKKLTIPAGLE